MAKYGNRQTEVDGLKFDSAKEARRYGELKLLERAGHIVGLKCQEVFPIIVKDTRVCTYKADFSYWRAPPDGRHIVEDVKSAYTRKLPVYRLKKKLLSAASGIEIVEV